MFRADSVHGIGKEQYVTKINVSTRLTEAVDTFPHLARELEHIHKENNVLFPLVLLLEADRA